MKHEIILKTTCGNNHLNLDKSRIESSTKYFYFLETKYGLLIIGVILGFHIYCFLQNVRLGMGEKKLMEFLKDLRNSDLKSILIAFIPSEFLSKQAYFLSELERPKFLKNFLLWLFHNQTGIELSDANNSDLYSYKNVQELFTRTLKQGSRPFDENAELISPSDGKVLGFGKIDISKLDDEEIPISQKLRFNYVKSQSVSLYDFLGPRESDELINHIKVIKNEKKSIYYSIIYLAPFNYHRFHSPADWIIESVQKIDGCKFCVTQQYIQMLPYIPCRNERVVVKGKWKYGKMYMIPVGALNVGGIVLDILPEFDTKRQKSGNEPKIVKNLSISMKKSEPVGKFLLGSNVVLIFEAPEEIEINIKNDMTLLLGTTLI